MNERSRIGEDTVSEKFPFKSKIEYFFNGLVYK